MGDYIKHQETGEIIKIACMGEVFYPIQKLIEFKNAGYRGFYEGKYDDTLERVITSPDSLFPVDHPGVYNHDFYVPAVGISHKDFYLIHNGYQYKVNCQESGHKVIKARITGERWRDGQRRTIFRCACCGTLFTIDHVTAMLLRGLFPQMKSLFKSDEERKEFGEDLTVVETLELIALSGQFSYRDFHILTLSNGYDEKHLQPQYRTLYQLYNDNQKLIPDSVGSDQ
jgi:hypothetical protein